MKNIRKFRFRRHFRQLGPGLITGAADDDPSGIATYSQAGAQFGFSMLWTVVLTLPLMVAIQIVSARIGYVTRKGLAANVMASFPRWVLLSVVGMLLLAAELFQRGEHRLQPALQHAPVATGARQRGHLRDDWLHFLKGVDVCAPPSLEASIRSTIAMQCRLLLHNRSFQV